jgi:hypothetical protein
MVTAPSPGFLEARWRIAVCFTAGLKTGMLGGTSLVFNRFTGPDASASSRCTCTCPPPTEPGALPEGGMRKARAAAAGWCAAAIICAVSACSGGPPVSTTTHPAMTAATLTVGSTAPVTVAATGAPAGGVATIVIEGQRHDYPGVVCTQAGDDFLIAIGDDSADMGVQMSDGDPPPVMQVGLGHVAGAVLGVGEGFPGSHASATKHANTYTITGTATGSDVPTTPPHSTPFQIDATCP